jgi:hypothetical protein
MKIMTYGWMEPGVSATFFFVWGFNTDPYKTPWHEQYHEERFNISLVMAETIQSEQSSYTAIPMVFGVLYGSI